MWYEPVIGGMACEDIKTGHLQAVVNAAPTAQEGKRLHALVSALVGAGIIRGRGLASARLKQVHWQANGRPSPPAQPASAEPYRVSVSFGRITQNSLPSGSARTVQDSAPVCPMSTRRAPSARSRSIS